MYIKVRPLSIQNFKSLNPAPNRMLPLFPTHRNHKNRQCNLEQISQPLCSLINVRTNVRIQASGFTWRVNFSWCFQCGYYLVVAGGLSENSISPSRGLTPEVFSTRPSLTLPSKFTREVSWNFQGSLVSPVLRTCSNPSSPGTAHPPTRLESFLDQNLPLSCMQQMADMLKGFVNKWNRYLIYKGNQRENWDVFIEFCTVENSEECNNSTP